MSKFYILKYIIRNSLILFLVLLLTILSSMPSKVSASNDPCSESYLRNLGVAALACEEENKCEVSTDTGPPAPPSGNTTPTTNLKEFVDRYGEAAYKNSLTSGIPYDFTLGQGILESGYGKSKLAANHNNFFGIKAGKNWTGATVTMRTREVVGGKSVYVNAAFRAYPNPQEGFSDHDKFLRENKRYAAAFKYPNDPYNFLVEVKKAGYATDPNYVNIVWKVIQSVQQYIATTNKFPPIKDVKYTIGTPEPGTPAPTVPGAPTPPATSECPDSTPPSTNPGNSDIGLVRSGTLPTNGTMKPTGIVLHWWGGTGGIGSLIGTLKSRGLAVQVGTTADGVAHQLTATLDAKAGHARCANGWAIGNEIEGGARLKTVNGQVIALDLAENQKQFNTVVDVTAKLMKLYNIPLDGTINPGGTSGSGVHSHKEVDKYCTNGTGKSDVDDIYLQRVKDELRKRGFK